MMMHLKALLFYGIIIFSVIGCGGDWFVKLVPLDSVYKADNVVLEANTNLNSIRTLLDVMQKGGQINHISPIYIDREIRGYTIDFFDNDGISIYLSSNESICHPNIGVKRDTDDVYCWTINNQFILDSLSRTIPVCCMKNDEHHPTLSIKDDFWQFSCCQDDGITLCEVEKSICFQNLYKDLRITETNIELVFNNGEAIKVPIYYDKKIYNPPVDLNKEYLKILDIGNSYTVDAQSYLPQILKAANVPENYSVYSAIRGAASFKSWVDCYNNRDSFDSYDIRKVCGKGIDGIAGVGHAYDGSCFKNVLEKVDWDIVLIHQVSYYANNFDLWLGHDVGGYLNELIEIIRQTNLQATIGYLMVHSYADNYSSNTEKSSYLRWENISNSTHKIKEQLGIDFIIPYGTAVENLRLTSLNDGSDFSTDGAHLAAGIGDYVASCCYYQTIFAPRFHKSILGNTFRQIDLDESIRGVKQIDDNNALLAQKSAILAVWNMWETINTEDNW